MDRTRKSSTKVVACGGRHGWGPVHPVPVSGKAETNDTRQYIACHCCDLYHLWFGVFLRFDSRRIAIYPDRWNSGGCGKQQLRVRFPNRDMFSQDMDIPADKPPQFGPYEDYTMYRADYKSVRYLDNKHFFDTVQNVMSAIVIVSGVVGLFIVLWLARPIAEVHQPPVK